MKRSRVHILVYSARGRLLARRSIVVEHGRLDAHFVTFGEVTPMEPRRRARKRRSKR